MDQGQPLDGRGMDRRTITTTSEVVNKIFRWFISETSWAWIIDDCYLAARSIPQDIRHEIVQPYISDVQHISERAIEIEVTYTRCAMAIIDEQRRKGKARIYRVPMYGPVQLMKEDTRTGEGFNE